jgi:hypothetical protein
MVDQRNTPTRPARSRARGDALSPGRPRTPVSTRRASTPADQGGMNPFGGETVLKLATPAGRGTMKLHASPGVAPSRSGRHGGSPRAQEPPEGKPPRFRPAAHAPGGSRPLTRHRRSGRRVQRLCLLQRPPAEGHPAMVVTTVRPGEGTPPGSGRGGRPAAGQAMSRARAASHGSVVGGAGPRVVATVGATVRARVAAGHPRRPWRCGESVPDSTEPAADRQPAVG